MTEEGKALYNGVLKSETDINGRKVTELSDDEDEPKNIYAYLLKNGLIVHNKEKTGDPRDMMP